MIYQCDVSSEEQVVKMFQQVISQFGTVDILINNAGVQKDAKFTEMTLDQWNTVININLTGQFLCAREAIKNFFAAVSIPHDPLRAEKLFISARFMKLFPGPDTPIMQPAKEQSAC